MPDCIFCNNEEKILSNDLAYARFDKFAVSEGHLLIIPFRHVANYFECTVDEKSAIWSLVEEGKKYLDKNYNPDAYNIGINAGIEAGQSIMHVHIHLIPRYSGDMENPKGGVRGVIPEKQNY
ncbi:MAG: HIT family protein [Melioribacteraceae bacterium]|nr:HIT family protein [Melioribacteraceae bacterium]